MEQYPPDMTDTKALLKNMLNIISEIDNDKLALEILKNYPEKCKPIKLNIKRLQNELDKLTIKWNGYSGLNTVYLRKKLRYLYDVIIIMELKNENSNRP